MLTLHASCVSIAGAAVLLRGPSGAGKSDLALRLVDAGAGLIADDRTCLRRMEAQLIACAPDSLRGLIEIRGLGPVRCQERYLAAAPAPVALIVDLVPLADVPRLPEPRFDTILDVALPCLALHAFEASAAIKVAWAVDRARTGRLFEPDEIATPAQSGVITELFKRPA